MLPLELEYSQLETDYLMVFIWTSFLIEDEQG